MGNKIRVRCPLCGMLVWQSRLNKDHKFEFVIQQSTGKGYKKIEHKYKTAYIANTDPAKIFQAVLALKMVEKAEELLKQVDTDIKIDVQIPDETEEELAGSYEEAGQESKVEHEVEHEIEQYVYEVEINKQEYEIEIPILQTEDVKRQSIFRRLWMRLSREREIEEMEAIRELEVEHDVKDVEYVVETFLRSK
jgi:hypothetical protein